MKFETINRKFTEVVSEWIGKGYAFNTATMGGSQGEIAKVDLTDGKEIIRILLNTESAHEHTGEGKDIRFYDFDLVTLTVGKATGKTFPHSNNTCGDTIWNDSLEELYREEFYQIGRRNGRYSKWYGTKAEAIAQQDTCWDRYRERFEPEGHPLNEAAKEIVLPFVRRQPRCKSVRLSEIERVTKHHIESCGGKRYVKYTVKARGQVFDLH